MGIISNLFWKLCERFGVLGAQFVLQIILARLLEPDDYGMLSLMLIFTTLSNVFIQNGFSTALIQNKNLSEEDYSSVFWISMGIASVAYFVLFISAPFIESYFRMNDMVYPFRTLSLVLFPGAFYSIQLAKISRELQFKKLFASNIGAILISGSAGIVCAYFGGGIWALVIQYLLNVVLASVIMLFTVKWYPVFVINIKRARILFAFGWKLLVSSLLETFYQDLSSLIIGRKFSSEILGYYNRGKQFPQVIINTVNGSVQSVLLPVMAKNQEHCEKVKNITRYSVMLSSYIIFPCMAGLAGVAKPLVSLLLTDKWLPCVLYLQIFCFSFAFWPVHTSNLQAINAMGRSDIYLWLEILKKGLGVFALIITISIFPSPYVIALSGCATSILSCFINAYPNRVLINYSYIEQIRDIVPSFLISTVMFSCINAIGTVRINLIFLLCIQIFLGAVIYISLSILFRLRPYEILWQIIKIKARKTDKP